MAEHQKELADEAQELWPLFARLRDATALPAPQGLPRRWLGPRLLRRAASLLVAAVIVAAALFFWFPVGDHRLLAEVTHFDGPVSHQLAAGGDATGCCSAVPEPLRVGCRLVPGTVLTCAPDAVGRVQLRSGCVLELGRGSAVRFDLDGRGLPRWTVQSGALRYECGMRECRIQAGGTELRAERSANVKVMPVANGADVEVFGGPVCVLRRTATGDAWEACAPGLSCCMKEAPPASRFWSSGR